jgi:hypothetical protein
MDNQHSTVRKICQVRLWTLCNKKQVYDNATYILQELDGTELRILVAGLRIKLFQKKNGDILFDDL